MSSIFLLSLKKLKENINHSIVFVICIVLLCILIILLGNICIYMQFNIRCIVLEDVAENGLDIEIRVTKNTKKLSTEHIEYAIDRIEEISDEFVFSARTNSEVQLNGKIIDCKPYFSCGMYDMQVLRTADTSKTNNGKDYIWLAESIEGYEVGQQINVTIDGVEEKLTIKGIVVGDISYVDYVHMNIQSICGNNLSKDMDWSKVKELYATIDDISKNLRIEDGYTEYIISSSIIGSYNYLNVLNIFCSGVCICLIAIVMALSVTGLINTVKINTNINQKFFAMLKTQGADNKAIMLYYFYQYLIYIIIGVTIASIVSAIILQLSLQNILQIFFGLLGYTNESFIIGFCWWLPLICIAVMVLVCLLVAAKETKRISKTEIATLLKEDV